MRRFHIFTVCEECKGKGTIPDGFTNPFDQWFYTGEKKCPTCEGMGLEQFYTECVEAIEI